jgi:hypothetical protein
VQRQVGRPVVGHTVGRIPPQLGRLAEWLVVGALPRVAVVERDTPAVNGVRRRADDDPQRGLGDAVRKRLVREVNQRRLERGVAA